MTDLMNRTLVAMGSACPSNTAGSVIGIHHNGTQAGWEELAFAVNNSTFLGTTAHGEIQALRACAAFLLGSPNYGKSYVKNFTFWQTLSLYTTSESCPMCMGAIRFARLGEVVYGTSVAQMFNFNTTDVIAQMSLFNPDIQQASNVCGSYGPAGSTTTAFQTRLVVDVAADYTNIFMNWTFNHLADCPPGCVRVSAGLPNTTCLP